MKKRLFISALFSIFVIAKGISQSKEKPNILWLVTEDMSPYLSCYGNTMIKTPNLDKLALRGIRFNKAYSNGTQCSPSRSTLISGKYAVSLGTDIHRGKRPVDDRFYFPIYLREAGYYCTNNSKEDYNNMKTPANVWDQSNGKAQYYNRTDKTQPFFAVYNQNVTHMVRVATRTVTNRDDSDRPIKLSEAFVPPYIADLPEVRNDISWNMGAVIKMDEWVGTMLQELKEKGEEDNTIIFFYADHGGTVPRGKAYAYESGTLVPFITYFPPKWKHLAAMPQPLVTNRMVSFVDFGATVLKLAGAQIPSFMVGKPFFSEAANQPENIRKYMFTFRSNQGPTFAPARTISDGRFKLIWNFQSAYPNGTRQDYQWQMPAQQAWDYAYQTGQLKTDLLNKFWNPVTTFEFYDLAKDSLETNDLAGQNINVKDFERLKKTLKEEIIKQVDLGFIPPEYRTVLEKDGDLFSVVRKKNINVNAIIDAAEVASMRNIKYLPQLLNYLNNSSPIIQYWGASGICGLMKVKLLTKIPTSAIAVFNKSNTIPEVKCMLAEAMVYSNTNLGLNYLYTRLESGFLPAAAALQNIGILAKPIAVKIEALLKQKNSNSKFYLRSILINCGVLPFSDLYKTAPGEKSGD